jgi:predicted SAM-dependent methyltransferase
MTATVRNKTDESPDPVLPAHRQGHALLNLGCGAVGHRAFVNVDLIAGPGIIGHDLRRGIPFRDRTYDLVYHSDMLSMLRPPDALDLMRECRRVLKPGGVLRVVTEDLERMCRVYLQKLEEAWRGDGLSAKDYEWMVLELYDQATREFSGGWMGHYLRQDPLSNGAFISSRIGEQARFVMSPPRGHDSQAASRSAGRLTLSWLRATVQRLVLTAVLGPERLRALDVGRFRLTSGQVSYQMYDRYSLQQLFLTAGLTKICLRTAGESAYAFWNEVNLDVSPDGRPSKPNTLIMEGIQGS